MDCLHYTCKIFVCNGSDFFVQDVTVNGILDLKADFFDITY